MRAQRGMRGVVLGAILGPEAEPDRHIARAAGLPQGQRFVQHLQAGRDQRLGDLALQADVGRAHRGDLEYAGELETMLGMVAVHAGIIGSPRSKPKLPVARFATPPQNDGMRSNHLLVLACVGAMLSLPLASPSARAQSTTIYRCETPAGISLQSKPCPKGVKQSKRSIQRPAEPIRPAPNPAPGIAASTLPPAMPVTAAADIRGPNDPYLLWQCMRADGSTFESRDGVPGKQWVVKPASDDSAGDDAATPAQITAPAKGPIVRHIETAEVVENAPAADPTPPPPGAAPGQWIADQCTRLEPLQACDRYAVRRDELRKQIYAAMPSERVKYAPEEQDLSKMLYAACGR